MLAVVGLLAAFLVRAEAPALAATAILGSGSSFAGIEFNQWVEDTGHAPYNLNVNYQSSSSGQGRQDFYDGTTNFGVSDIRYDPLDDQGNIPNPSTFAYIPVTAGGISFMYNLRREGFTNTTAPIKLSPLTVCGMFMSGIQYWDDPAIKADNPGVNLPHVLLHPVIRSDASGTNYVMEQYCIALEPALFKAYLDQWNNSSAVKGGGGQPEPDNQPTSYWPLQGAVIGANGSDGVAAVVDNANDDGYIGAAETGYAIEDKLPYTAVKNDTGAYVQPTPAAVSAALGHATQLNDGTQQLNFSPGDAAAYNPSTYSYLLVRNNYPSGVAAAVTQFAEYDLTIGQQEAPQLGYATINRNLIEFGLQRLQSFVPGAATPTSAETAAIPAAGTNPNPTTNPTTITSTPTTSGGSGSTATTGAGSTGSAGSSGSSQAGGVGSAQPAGAAAHSVSTQSAGTSALGSNPGASPVGASGVGSTSGGTATSAGGSAGAPGGASATLGSPTGPLGQTGVESDVLIGLGGVLLVVGEAWRRRAMGRARSEP